MSALDVVCVGSAKHDTLAWVDHRPEEDERIVTDRIVSAPGGNANTAATALARLGARVALCTTIGDDSAGRFLLERMEEEGIDTRFVVRDRDLATPQSINIAMGSSATRTIITVAAHPGDRSRALAADTDWLHFDAEGYADARADLRLRGSSKVSIDAGIRIGDADMKDFDLFVPTREQIEARYPGVPLRAAMESAVRDGAGAVVVTDGPRGSTVLDRGRFTDVPAFEVDVVSTLGAGDVFHGSLIAGLVRGLDLPEAAIRASAAAALACRALDGQSSIPTWSELEDHLAAISGHRVRAGMTGTSQMKEQVR